MIKLLSSYKVALFGLGEWNWNWYWVHWENMQWSLGFFASRMVGNGGLFRNKSRTEFWVVLQFGKILFWIWIFIELYVLKVTM